MMEFLKKNALPALLLTVLLDMLGLGITMPILPVLFGPGHSYFALEGILAGRDMVVYGLLTAIVFLGQFIGAPIIGQFSDKFGRRKVLIVTILAGVFANIIFIEGLLAKSIYIVLLSRFIFGLMAGNAAVAGAAIADISKPEDRAKNFGLMGAMFGIGFILGPVLGGVLSNSKLVSWFSFTTPFYVSLILGIINAAYVWMMLPETNAHVSNSLTIKWSQAISNIKKALDMKEVRPMLVTAFLFSAGIMFYQSYGSILLQERFGFDQGDLGKYFAYVGVWLVIAQAGFVRVLAKRFKSAEVLSVSMFVMSVCFFAIAGNHVMHYIFFISPFLALAWGSTMANMSSLLSQTASPKIMGEVMGINTSVGALASMIVPVIAGSIAQSHGVGVAAAMAGVMLAITGAYFVIYAKHVLKPHA